MKKKIIACLLAGIMAMSTLAGCGSTETNKESTKTSESTTKKETQESVKEESKENVVEEAKPLYPIEGNVTLTVGMVEEAPVVASVDDLGETPFGKAWEEATGVEVEYIQTPDANGMNLLFASGELPDIILFNWGGYSGGPAKAIKDKLIQPINDYMEYAPDLQAVFDSNVLYKNGSTTDEGDIIGFPFIRGSKSALTSAGWFLRSDWLEELGMDLPRTPDDVYEVLKAFKEEKGAEYPLSMIAWYLDAIALEHGLLTSPFGLPKTGFYQDNGELHWGITQKEYKDVLTWLHKLYDEKLLDPNFATIDQNTVNANMMNGVTGMTIGTAGSGMGTYLNTMAESGESYDLAGFAPLVAKEGDVPMSTHYDFPVTTYYAIVTPQCKNKEAAVAFLNYGYSEEGSLLMNYGIEGESYDVVDYEGRKLYITTDLINHNPDGLSAQYANALYNRTWSWGPMVQVAQELPEEYNTATLPQQAQAKKEWINSTAEKYIIPSLAIKEDDLAEYTKLTTDIYTFTSEMTVKYITGLADLNNFETEYLGTLEKMGIERVLEIHQEALDRFNSR